MSGKKYHSHDEIHLQYTSIRQTAEYIFNNNSIIKDFFAEPGDVVFVACGSSYWMSLSAHKTMHLFTDRRTFAVKAGDIVMCPEEYTSQYENPVILCPSRSGRTKECLDAIDILQKAYPGCRVLSVVEYKENELSKKSDLTLYISWANETSVCQTRSFSNLYAAFITMAAVIGNKKEFAEQFKLYLNNAPLLYTKHESKIQALADPESVTSLVTLGSGLQYGVVVEGAYIVIEMAEFASNYYQLLEYRHGPIVTSDKNTAVFICSGGQTPEIEAKMAADIRETGAKVYAVACSDEHWADYTFSLEGGYVKELVALHFVFILQSFAHHFSIARGKNPDSPGNLVPFIVY